MKKNVLLAFVLLLAYLASAQNTKSNAQYFDHSGTDITVAAKLYPIDWFSGTYGAGVEAMFADIVVVGIDVASINKSEYSRGISGFNSPLMGNGFSFTVKANYVMNDDLLGDYAGLGLSYDYGNVTLEEGSLATYEVFGVNYVQHWSFFDHFYLEGLGGLGIQRSNQNAFSERDVVIMLNFAIGYIFNP